MLTLIWKTRNNLILWSNQNKQRLDHKSSNELVSKINSNKSLVHDCISYNNPNHCSSCQIRSIQERIAKKSNHLLHCQQRGKLRRHHEYSLTLNATAASKLIKARITASTRLGYSVRERCSLLMVNALSACYFTRPIILKQYIKHAVRPSFATDVGSRPG